jgi:hypothetical protein
MAPRSFRLLGEDGGGGGGQAGDADAGNAADAGGGGGGGGGASCCADDAAWSSAYGGACSTYALGGENEGYCTEDGADAACKGTCGTCVCTDADEGAVADFSLVYEIGVPVMLAGGQ